MATYAVGDIQGCLQPLKNLLLQAGFNTQKDRLWVAGDMVNRGPESLATLRFLFDLRERVQTELGNHDLHLLAVAAGYRQLSASDTLTEILNAPDKDSLLEWLRQQPLLHHDAQLGYTMVHAGIPPQWTLRQAMGYAREVEAVLQGEQRDAFLQSMYGSQPDCWDEQLTGMARWRLITNYFTRMRFCTPEGQLELATKKDIHNAPPGYLPWYAHNQRLTDDDRIIFGHWAALKGKADHNNVFALDTGCVWGGPLTMMRLEDQRLFMVNC